jgi:hypothetical protein
MQLIRLFQTYFCEIPSQDPKKKPNQTRLIGRFHGQRSDSYYNCWLWYLSFNFGNFQFKKSATPVSSTNKKIDHKDITEILSKVALIIIKQTYHIYQATFLS